LSFRGMKLEFCYELSFQELSSEPTLIIDLSVGQMDSAAHTYTYQPLFELPHATALYPVSQNVRYLSHAAGCSEVL
jgi:hypothetical protein